MDFLDSLDLHGNDHKSNRMRSWYLYEQYKSLERHQLDAAERLKERSYQERLLHQELTERRARRSLYQQRGLCRSEPYVDRKDTLSISTDDFYPSFCELQDEEVVHTIEADLASVGSRDDSEIDKTEYFNTLEDNDDSNDSSVKSVVLKSKSDEKLDTEILNEEIKEDLKFEKCDIAENINLQLEAVKENIQSLEKYARLSDVGESESSNSSETCKLPVVESSNKNLSIYESNIFVMWSRLVSFAYQVIQLNHGNCYYDYGSQLMTAVLACDVLRRGVNRMSLRFADKVCY